jgi:hypothetical protein
VAETDDLKPGTRVRFGISAVGTIHLDDPYRFTEYIAAEHDTGTIYSSPGAMPEGWVLVHLDEKDEDGHDLYAPVHPSMIEVAA